jgi:hypothetical protein
MKTDIPSGTLSMLILKTLARLGPMHGYGIAQFIQQTTEDVLHLEEGTLYPAFAPDAHKRVGQSGMACHRKQAPRAVLHAHAGRPKTGWDGGPSVQAGDLSSAARD